MAIFENLNIFSGILIVIAISFFFVARKLTRSYIVSILITVLSIFSQYNILIVESDISDTKKIIYFVFKLLTLLIILLMFGTFDEFNDDAKNNVKIVVDYEDDKSKKNQAIMLGLIFLLYVILFFITEKAIILFIPIFLISLFAFEKKKVMKTREEAPFDASNIISVMSFMMINVILYMVVFFSRSEYFTNNYPFINNNAIAYLTKNIQYYLSETFFKFINYYMSHSFIIIVLLHIMFLLLFIIYFIIKNDYIKMKKEKMIKINIFYEYRIDLIIFFTLISSIIYDASLNNKIDYMTLDFFIFIVYLIVLYFYRENRISYLAKTGSKFDDGILLISNYILDIAFLLMDIYFKYSVIFFQNK